MFKPRVRFSVSLFTMMLLLYLIAVALVTWSVSYEFNHFVDQQQVDISHAYYRSIEKHLSNQLMKMEMELNQAKAMVGDGLLKTHARSWRVFLRDMLAHAAFKNQKMVWLPVGGKPVVLGQGGALLIDGVAAPWVHTVQSKSWGHDRVQWHAMKLPKSGNALIMAGLALRNTQQQTEGSLVLLIDQHDLASALKTHLGVNVMGAEIVTNQGDVVAASMPATSGGSYTTWQQALGQHFLSHWSLRLSLSDQHAKASLFRLHKRTMGIVLLILLIGAGLIYALSRAFATLLNGLIHESKKIARFDLSKTDRLTSWVVEFDAIIRAVQHMKVGLRGFIKYVPVELVRRLLQSENEVVIGGRKAPMTIMFSDITGYTQLMESERLQDMTDHLCLYFDICSEHIQRFHGTIDKYIGDSVMAFWGAPQEDPQQVIHACQAALSLQSALQSTFLEWEQKGLPLMRTRIGLDCGETVVGNIGSSRRLNYTVLGDAVNAASRLEALASHYGVTILVSESVYQQVRKQCHGRHLDTVSVKGQSRVMSIYALYQEVVAGQYENYSNGLEAYFKGDWSSAANDFAMQLKVTPEDGPSQLMLKRCQDPCPKGWDGVWHYHHK